MSALKRIARLACLLAWGVAGAAGSESVDISGGHGRPITVVVRDAPIAEVFEMLSRSEQLNILLSKDVEGEVSVNLYDVSLDRAIRGIAEAAGYVAERRGVGYLVLKKEEAGQEDANGNTRIRTLRVHYSDPQLVSEILEKHLSRYGELTVLPDRRLIVVEDRPDFLDRLERLVAELDLEPRQILIESKILEISLEENQEYGIDWERTFEIFGSSAAAGVVGLANPASPGFFFRLLDDKTAVLLTALAEEGRVRTLATPTLLALEDEQAEVVIGDRLGFRVVTTINEVTSESVEFLESGVILRITARVDRKGRVMLDVHPEVSTGVIEDGLPQQTTTEVTTKLIADDGKQVFIGGLIRDRSTRNVSGVPFLKDIPFLGWLFRNHDDFDLRAETVVVLTAHVVEEGRLRAAGEQLRWLPRVEDGLERHRRELEQAFDAEQAVPASPAPEPDPGESAPAP